MDIGDIFGGRRRQPGASRFQSMDDLDGFAQFQQMGNDDVFGPHFQQFQQFGQNQQRNASSGQNPRGRRPADMGGQMPGGMHGMPGMGNFENFGGQQNGPFFGQGRRVGGNPQRGNYSNYGEEPPKPADLVVDLPCTLEQLYNGCVRKMKIPRRINGQISENVLTIDVKPGWKDGTKITFPGEGEIRQGMRPQDVVFIIRESKHPVFTREKDDLIVKTPITLRQALCGFAINQKGIDGEDLKLVVKDVVQPGSERRLCGKGMKRKNGGRGDMIFKFDIRFPAQVTPEMKEGLKRYLPAY